MSFVIFMTVTAQFLILNIIFTPVKLQNLIYFHAYRIYSVHAETFCTTKASSSFSDISKEDSVCTVNKAAFS